MRMTQKNRLKPNRPRRYFKMRMSRAMELLGPKVYSEYKQKKLDFWKMVKEDERYVIRRVEDLMKELDFNDEGNLNYLMAMQGEQLTMYINKLAGLRDRLGDIANEYMTDANFIYRYWKNKYVCEFTPAKLKVTKRINNSDIGEKLYKEDIEAEVQKKVWEEQLMEVIIQEFGNYLITKVESIEIRINALKDRLKEKHREMNTPDY